MDENYEGFVPYSKRDKTPEPKIEEELTENAQHRLANVVYEYPTKGDIVDTHKKYESEYGDTKGNFGRGDPEIMLQNK
jgi:hypothetical protein